MFLLVAASLLAFVFVALRLFASMFRKRSSLPYPPGPKGHWLLGNLHDIPKVDNARVYAEWGKKYESDVVHASVLGQHVVVINSREAADDLFEKRSTIYNSRHETPLLKLFGDNLNLAFLPYDKQWRDERKYWHQQFGPQAVKTYYPAQLERVRFFLKNLSHDPENFMTHAKLFSISLHLQMMYGYVPSSISDPFIVLGDKINAMADRGLVLLQGTLINVFPWLRFIPPWVPGATTRKLISKIRSLSVEQERIPLDHARKMIREGKPCPSFISTFLEKEATIGVTKKEEEQVKSLAFGTYTAATETLTSVVTTLIHLLATHPEVQRRARLEIDSVIGSDRLPDFDDRESLPYIDAIYRELMRWNPPSRTPLPHSLSEDDVYRDWFLPKGTIVIGNVWAMTHDETVYHDPFAFRPERFLNEDGQLNDDSRILAYGFGRRVCVGKNLASSTVWLTIASLIASFDIGKAKDSLGNDIEIDNVYIDLGLTNHKTAFKCSIIPRSEAMHQLIESTGVAQ